jgi:hypothetical protein
VNRFLTVVSLLICAASPALADAPADLAGRIFRTSGGWPSLRFGLQRTVLFNGDGRYVTLYCQRFLTHIHETVAEYSEGSYTYRRTSPTTATLVLDPGSAELGTELLFFNSDFRGRWENAGGQLSGTFSLSALSDAAPLVNISTRANTRPGNSIIAGFIVGGDEPREVIIRAIGPGLNAFGLSGTWSDPDYLLYSMGTHPAKVPWPGSRDAADVVRLAPGGYTVNLEAVSPDPGGEVLIEVFLLP